MILLFPHHNAVNSREDIIAIQGLNQPKVGRYSIRNLFSKSKSEPNKTKSNYENHSCNSNKIVRDGDYIKDFRMLIKLIESPKVKDFTDRQKDFEECFQKLSASYDVISRLRDDILLGSDYKKIKSSDGFKNICNEIEKVNESKINLSKIVKQIQHDKLKIVCEIVEKGDKSGYVHERDTEMEETRLKIIDCKMECKKLYIYMNLQTSLVDLVSTLKSSHLPDFNSEEFGFFKSILNYWKPAHSTYDEKFDIIDSQDELALKKLMIDPKYCEIDVKTLQKLDQIVGMIIDSSRQLKNDNICKARKLVATISPESPGKGDVTTSVFKAQRLIYVLNGLLIGKYDSLLNTVYAKKQKYEDKKQKQIVDEVIQDMRNSSVFQKLNRYISKQNLDDIFKKQFENKKAEVEKYQKHYDHIFFDKNTCILLDTLQNSNSANDKRMSISFTNINGVQSNVFVQNGSSLTQGGIYITGRNTIGPAFYLNLIGSEIDSGINAIGTIHNGKKVVRG